tara:strand:+ start:5262 stop:5999 length:738 start_codon:yes stop_codon:yes gene_type:complete
MTFFLLELVKFISFWTLAFILGNCVHNYKIKVNYTRKIHHFALLFFPIFLASYFPYQPSELTGLIGAFGFVWTLLPFYFRKNNMFLERCYLSFDRPEDRPYTFLWLYTQFFASIVIVISLAISAEIYFGIFWADIGLLVVCLAMIGDGLAEPIGVRFGRIKYKTYALFTKKRFFRTVEGSLTVFVSTIGVLVWFGDLFTEKQFMYAIAFLPLTLTVTEAISPHTWDGPLLSGVSGILVCFILMYF